MDFFVHLGEMVFAFLHPLDCDFHIWAILLIDVVRIIMSSRNYQIALISHAFPFAKLILWLC